MALAEASVRVVIEVARFERDLRNVVTKAAQRAGKDLERELSKGFSAAAKKGVADFRNAVNTAMTRAGKDAVTSFKAGFSAGLGQFAGRVGTQLGNGLKLPIGKAGTQAGQTFASNVSSALQGQGSRVANQFVNAIGGGLTSRGATVGRNAGQAISRALSSSTVAAARTSGSAAGRQFSLSFGVGTAGVSRRAAVALAVIGGEIATEFGPALNILAGFPPLLLAMAAGATVAGFAFRGIGDAFKAIGKNDIEDLSAAMEKLSPSARSVVREFLSMRTALNGVQRSIQEAFFGPLQGQFTDITNLLQGRLNEGITDVAASLGNLAREFLGVFTSARGAENLAKVLQGTRDFVEQLRPGVRDLLDGFLAFSAEAAPGLNSIGEAFSNLLSRMGQFLSRAAKSGDALKWVEEGVQGVKSLGKTLGDLADIVSTIAGALRPLAFALSGVFNLVTKLAEAFAALPGPIQTAILAAVLLSRSGLPDFLNRTVERAKQLPSVFQQMRSAFVITSTVAADFVRQQTQIISNSRALGGASQATTRAIGSIGSAFGSLVGTAAGAGSAIATGLGGALRGLVGFLGGPWGIAFAAAGVVLSLFSDRQQDAARRVAEWNAGVREIQGTLNKSTGAVTQMTLDLAAQDDAVKRATSAFQQYGVSAEDVLRGALQQGSAHDRVEAALRRQTRSYVDAIKANGDLDLVMQATGLSAEELTTALLGGGKEAGRLTQIYDSLKFNQDATSASVVGLIDKLRGQTKGLTDARNGWLDYFNKTQKASEAQRLIAASIPPAARETQRMADAMGILADNTSDASAKAAAFNDIMEILAGGTIDVQAAQARYNEILQRVAADTKETVDQTKGYGEALIQANGQINTATVNGNNLFKTYQDLTSGLSTTNGALIDNALKTGDVSGALVAVKANVAQARQAFIEQATAMGIPQKKAEELANAYGLIPEKVATEVALPTYENVRAQIVDVNNKLKDIPPGKEITVGALTEEAVKRLNEVGIKTERLPDGNFKVVAQTEDAKSALSSLVANWGNRVLNWAVNIIGNKAAGDIVENAKGNVLGFARGGQFRRLTPMSANRAQIVPPNTWRVIGDRAQGDEAYIPITNSARSRALLAETARRMGFTLLANGGMSKGSGRNVQVASGAIVVNAPFADPQLVARATLNELARQAAS